MTEPIEVPTIGSPEWKGDIPESWLTSIIGGVLTPNQSLAKAMARKLREYMRKEVGNE